MNGIVIFPASLISLNFGNGSNVVRTFGEMGFLCRCVWYDMKIRICFSDLLNKHFLKNVTKFWSMTPCQSCWVNIASNLKRRHFAYFAPSEEVKMGDHMDQYGSDVYGLKNWFSSRKSSKLFKTLFIKIFNHYLRIYEKKYCWWYFVRFDRIMGNLLRMKNIHEKKKHFSINR